MSDELENYNPNSIELGIVNLDKMSNIGSHWIAYTVYHKKAYYYDSFGNLKAPKSIQKYLHKEAKIIYYNLNRHQKLDSFYCGHYSLLFLINFYKNFIQSDREVDHKLFTFLDGL